VLRANQVWAPYPDNDPDAARALMQRFYALVAVDGRITIDPAHAARLEVEWWRVHREHQYDPAVANDILVNALVDLYSYVYSAPRESMRDAARFRVEAMDHSDRWAKGGCERDDPNLAAERLALVASYSALRDAVARALGLTPFGGHLDRGVDLGGRMSSWPSGGSTRRITGGMLHGW
jgi:hypothetical protein